MRTKIFKAGEEGFLFIDLLSAIVILSLTTAVIFGGVRNLRESQRKVIERCQTSREAYESILLDQIGE